jgi:hypothetical protein
MALEAKQPHNLVVGLQSSNKCKVAWPLFLIIITKNTTLFNQIWIKKEPTKVPNGVFGFGVANICLQTTK